METSFCVCNATFSFLTDLQTCGACMFFKYIICKNGRIVYFPSKLEKLRYKYYNLIAICMQNQPYHEIQDIEIYQISKFKKSNLE